MQPQDADLDRRLARFVGFLCSALGRSLSEESTAALLGIAYDLLYGGGSGSSQEGAGKSLGAGPGAEDLQALASLASDVYSACRSCSGDACAAARAALARSEALPSFLDALFASAPLDAAGNSGRDPPLATLIDALLVDAPADALLEVAAAQLTALGATPAVPGQARVQLASADAAWSAIRQRFLDPASGGFQDVAARVSEGSLPPARIAGHLASVAESVPGALPDVLRRVCALACGSSVGAAHSDIARELLQRLVRRGHAAPVTSTLVPWARGALVLSAGTSGAVADPGTCEEHAGCDEVPSPEGFQTLWAALLGWLDTVGDMERLLAACARELSSGVDLPRRSGSVSDTSAVPGWAARACAVLLREHVDGPACTLALQKLFCAHARPLPALAVLVSALRILCNEPRPAANPALPTDTPAWLSALARHAARIWAAPDAVSGTPVPTMAFSTEAFLALLRLLGPGGTPAVPGLVPSVLNGVSTRLGSPIPAVRRQAMRVGNAFAALCPAPPRQWGAGEPATGLAEDTHAMGPDATGDSPSQKALFEHVAVDDFTREERWPGMWGDSQASVRGAGRGVERGARGSGEVGAAPARDGRSVRRGAGVQDGSAGAPGKVDASESGKWTVDMAEACPDSDDEGGADDASVSEDSLAAFDMSEEADAVGVTGNPLPDSLGALVKQLRSGGEDSVAVVDALGVAEELIRGGVEELPIYAAELTHVLAHTHVPEWADGTHRRGERGASTKVLAEAGRPSQGPTGEQERMGALVAVVVATPALSGVGLLRSAFAEGMDMAQRLSALDAVVMAARELAGPGPASGGRGLGGGAAGGALPGKGGEGRGGQHAGVAGATRDGGDNASRGETRGATSAGGPENETAEASSSTFVRREGKAGRTRVWGHRALAARDKPRPRQWRNRLAPVVRQWAHEILQGIGSRSVSLEPMGRDFVVLGRSLAALGSLAECAAPHDEGVAVTAALLTALRAPAISQHAQPFVRRMALLSVVQALGSLPPAAVAGALVSQGPSAIRDGVVWAREWAETAANRDSDEQCRALASACMARHAQLARDTASVLEAIGDDGAALLGLGAGPDPIRKALGGMSRLSLQ